MILTGSEPVIDVRVSVPLGLWAFAVQTGDRFWIFDASIATTVWFFVKLTSTISTLPRTIALTIVLASQL